MEVGIHVAFRAQWTNILAGSSPVIAIVSMKRKEKGMSVTRREFLSKTSVIGMGALLPFTHHKAKDELPRISSKDVLSTVFMRHVVEYSPHTSRKVIDFPSGFFPDGNCISYVMFDKDGQYFQRVETKEWCVAAYSGGYYWDKSILVPMIPMSDYKTINSQAFQLLAYAALDSDKPVLHPTHELITQVGVVQLDLRLKDSFVFPTRRSAHTNEYGLAVLDPSKIGMRQQ